jgi:predicted ATPase/signal transduction histidine kinase
MNDHGARTGPSLAGLELSRCTLEALRDDRDFALYRARGNTRGWQALVLATTSEYPTASSLARLDHEYALRGELQAPWAARPLALVPHDGRPVLILEDPGGLPLESLLRGRLPLEQCLRVAIGVAAALGAVHARGLIHKDLKPGNILVMPDTGAVCLTGFGIASQLPRERQAPEPPDILAGTLAYMAPEQTGRMNRSIDSRSDLYALGITLYEMLTGALPFAAADPVEWVHCHVARQPRHPTDRSDRVPAPLGAVVMKLLAKTAEERYQTASGVEADLGRCLTDWTARDRIEPFRLGTRDAPDRLRIPEKLYGRARECAALLAAFDRVVASGTPELVVVSGYSGIGKSSIVYELHKAIVLPRGLFASGKFDQYTRDIPYATLAQAFQLLVRQILSRPPAEADQWRAALQEALGANGALLVNLVPELALVMGPQPPVRELPSTQAQTRFQTTFRRFVGVFARAEHPLVLFLDDLQWLDAATLQVLEHLATHPEVRHLLLIGAYRDNEVGPSHPLMRALDAVRAAGTIVQDLVLAPLSPDDVRQLIEDALVVEDARVIEDTQPGASADHDTLARLVRQKTGGNPFFAIQFLATLADEHLLARDARDFVWRADLEGIRAKGFTDNVVDLMVRKLSRLPPATQEALQRLACLGNVAASDTAALVHGVSEAAMRGDLWTAVRDGLLLRADGTYRFLHDRVQEAAYSLIPVDQRAGMHLRIGRLLVAKLSADDIADRLFDVVNQLNLGAALITDRDERDRTAELNLRAGRKAKASTAYASAGRYFELGIARLDPDVWARRYDLAFGLWIGRAECEFLTGHLTEAERLLTDLLPRARQTLDEGAVHALLVELYVVACDYPKAVDGALACLRLYGIDMPAHPTPEQSRLEDAEVWRQIGDRSVASLIDLPRMTDPVVMAAARVLSSLMAPAFFTDVQLHHVTLCRMVTLTLQYGTTSESALGYAWYGLFGRPRYHRHAEAEQFATLASDLIERHAFVEQKAMALHSMEMATVWTQPITVALTRGRAACRAAIDTGDLSTACFAATHITVNRLARGDALDEVWREAEQQLAFVQKTGFRDAADTIVSQRQFIQAMRGLTVSCSSFTDDAFDEQAFEASLEHGRMPTMVCWHWVLRTQAWFLSGDSDRALATSARADVVLPSSEGLIPVLDFHYYTALAIAALDETGPPAIREARRAQLARHLTHLREWAEHCSVTFRDKYLLVAAEAARLDHRDLDAMRLYEDTIRAAREHGFIQYEATAHEVAARFYGGRGFDTIAAVYMRHARDAYRRWGAHGKVRQIDRRWPTLGDQEPRAGAPGSPDVSGGATISASVDRLDLVTVAKASQAVSREIVVDKVIETLLIIAVEHAGAERGLLILPQDGHHAIEAEAITREDALAVVLRRRPMTPADVPDSILHYVIRTQASLVLDDASADPLFAADAYVRERHLRSVLCVPLVKQATLAGVLYLENNLTPRAFTAGRLVVLELLAAQAAISLENARLFTDLQQENAERRRAEEALRGLPARLLQAQEDERRRIARDLHDDISQQIALLAITVDRLHQEIAETQPETSRRLFGVLERAQDISESVRQLSHELHSTNLDHLGLQGAVRGFCQEFTAHHGIGVDVRCARMPPLIPSDVAGALFRIVQEALQNVARHSGARSAIVEIGGTPDEVRLTIEDKGRGFDAGATPSFGIGLASMRERLRLLGGHCAIHTAPSMGTRIEATVPTARPDAPAIASSS